MKRLVKKFLLFICCSIIILITILSCISLTTFYASKIIPEQLSTPNEEKERKELRVLVVEMDPILKTKSNKRCSEYKKYGDYAGNTDKISDEVLADLEYASNGYITTKIVGDEFKNILKDDKDITIENGKIRLNEFPTYNKEIELKNGQKSKKLDEETWLEIMKHGDYAGSSEGKIEQEQDNSSWYKYRNQITGDSNCIFDYRYLAERLHLIEYRDKFDWLLIVSIQPSKCFEACMMGKTAYWINGKEYIMDCENFPVIWANVGRRDSILHSVGHMSENIMSFVFNGDRNDYGKKFSIKSQDDYDKLNLWEKFSLAENNLTADSTREYMGVGNVHYAPNSKADYEYKIEGSAYSNWKDWRNNYPNLKGEWKTTNSNTWNKNSKNDPFPEGNTASDRLHMRWWFKSMPHISGRTEDGYYHNWWKYITTLDFVTNISANNEIINLKLGENANKVSYTLTYKSGKTEKIESNEDIQIEDTSVLEVSSKGLLVVKKAKDTVIHVWRDGKKCDIIAKIEGAKGKDRITLDSINRGEIRLDKTYYIYDGKAKEPTPTVKIGERVLEKDKDYTVSYSNNINVGTAKVIITGAGIYDGEIELEYRIVKEVTDLQNLKNTEISILDFSENMEVEYNTFSHKFRIDIKDGQEYLRERTRLYS